MGLLSNGIEKARVRQRDAIIEEGRRCGTLLTSMVVAGDDPSSAGVLGAMAKVFVGGTMSADDVQIFSFDTQGFSHTFIQPYDGMNPMPGLHRATLPGSVPFPAILKAKSFGRSAWCDADSQNIDALNAQSMLAMVTSKLEWKWRAGTTEISLPWTVQMRPTGGGTTEVALRSGRYGGFTTFGVGIRQFVTLCGSIHSLTSPTVVPGAPFIIDTGFTA